MKCPECDTPFTPPLRQKNKQYCSRRCKEIAYRRSLKTVEQRYVFHKALEMWVHGA